MIVLDTNVLSEPLKLRPDERVLAWLASLDEEACVTSISVGELLSGVRVLPVGRRREGLMEAIEATLRTFAGSVPAYDETAARHYARLQESRRWPPARSRGRHDRCDLRRTRDESCDAEDDRLRRARPQPGRPVVCLRLTDVRARRWSRPPRRSCSSGCGSG